MKFEEIKFLSEEKTNITPLKKAIEYKPHTNLKNDAAKYMVGDINAGEIYDKIQNTQKKELDGLTKNDVVNSDIMKNKFLRLFKLVNQATYYKEKEGEGTESYDEDGKSKKITKLDGGLPIYKLHKLIEGDYYDYFFIAPANMAVSAIGAYIQEAIKKILKFNTGAFVGVTDSNDGVGSSVKSALRENLPVQVKSFTGDKKSFVAGNYDNLNNYKGEKIVVVCKYKAMPYGNNKQKIYFRKQDVRIENTSSLLNNERKIKMNLKKAANSGIMEAEEFYKRFIKAYNTKTAFKDIGRTISKVYRDMYNENVKDAKYDMKKLKKILEEILGNDNVGVVLRTGGRNMEVSYKNGDGVIRLPAAH